MGKPGAQAGLPALGRAEPDGRECQEQQGCHDGLPGKFGRATDRDGYRCSVELSFADGTIHKRHPLGLVLRAGSWFLVSVEQGGLEVVCLDDLRATRITRQTFRAPEDFDLGHVLARAP